jgi:hypothetical protein
MAAETAAAAARQPQEEAEEAREARDKAIEAAKSAGIEPPDLEPLASDAIPRRGLARKADGTPTKTTQRNHRCAEGFA